MKHRLFISALLFPLGCFLVPISLDAWNSYASSRALQVAIFSKPLNLSLNPALYAAAEFSAGTQLPSESSSQETTIGELNFKLAPGWHLQNTTTESLTTWPIAATFDAQNNLIVAESAGVQDSVQKQWETLPHRVVRLLDTDHDGIFDKRQVVAEQLPFPEGVLCVGNDILVSAPPQIIRLIDADGDGVAESRSVWHDGKTLTGCANDLHGPFLGPEGWLYWCKAAFAEQTPSISGPFPSKSTASHLYRKRLNDDQADRVMTGGMDNLVDITFDSLGERFFVATFLHHPGGGVRDGLGHAPYGAVYGKSNAVLQGHPRTGPLFTPMVEMGPAAPAGILAVSDANFPKQPEAAKSWSSTLIAAQFNLQRVSMHQTTPHGSAFQSKDTDLVVSDQLDFHPVDILQDIDGSLIVVDTGGWYDLCCPSSGSEHRIAPGGIYRLSPKDLAQTPTAYQNTWTTVQTAWKQGDWSLLLKSDQKRVRDLGVEGWLNSGANVDSAGKPIDETDWLAKIVLDAANSTEVRASAFWAIARWIEKHDQVAVAPPIVNELLNRNGDPLQTAALNLISTYRWKDQRLQLEEMVQNHPSLTVRRLAAECLGRIADKSSIQAILRAWDLYHSQTNASASAQQPATDRTFQHAIFFALIEIASYAENRSAAISELTKTLQSEERSDQIALASLSTLQQIGATTPSLAPVLLTAMNSKLEPLSQIAQEVLATQVDCLQAYLNNLPVEDNTLMLENAPNLARILTLSKGQSVAKDWIEKNVLGQSLDSHSHLGAPSPTNWKWITQLEILQSFRNQSLPLEWDATLGAQLKELHKTIPLHKTNSTNGDDGTLHSSGSISTSPLVTLVDLLRQTKISEDQKSISSALRSITSELSAAAASSAGDATQYLSLATAAIATAPSGGETISSKVQMFIVDTAVGSDRSAAAVAWQAISKLDLEPIAWQKLFQSLDSIPTNDYPKAVEALARSSSLSTTAALGTANSVEQLIGTILASPITRTLSPEQIKKWFETKPDAIKHNLDTKLTELFAPPVDMKLSIETLAESLPAGDAFRGQDVYRSSKAACSACHRIGYVGGNLGPELTRIGRSRNQRDFIEAILYPSHRIEQGFSSTNILTVDDEVITGIVTFEDDSRVEIATSADKVVSVDKSDIQERTNSTTSLMPAGIDKLLSKQEIADLLAFLQQAK